MKRNNGGFTLIEVLISIVVLGLVVLPVCSSLVMATRINAKAESILDAKLAVSSAVETMMAEGISSESNDYQWWESANPYPNVKVTTEKAIKPAAGENPEEVLPYYNVTVTYTESGKELVSVTTQIRAGGGAG